MKTHQVIMKSGLTRIIEAENVIQTDHSIEFQVDGQVTAIFRTETVQRIEAFDDRGHLEIIFPDQKKPVHSPQATFS